MCKNVASRDLKIYMTTHTTRMYQPTKFHINWSIGQGDVIKNMLKWIFVHMDNNLSSRALKIYMNTHNTPMYQPNKFYVNRHKGKRDI